MWLNSLRICVKLTAFEITALSATTYSDTIAQRKYSFNLNLFQSLLIPPTLCAFSIIFGIKTGSAHPNGIQIYLAESRYPNHCPESQTVISGRQTYLVGRPVIFSFFYHTQNCVPVIGINSLDHQVRVHIPVIFLDTVAKVQPATLLHEDVRRLDNSDIAVFSQPRCQS